MKKILFIVAFLSGIMPIKAAEVFTPLLANETALAYSTTYDYFANQEYSKRIGATVTYTSATLAGATFTDGRTSSGTIVIVSTTGLSGQYITLYGIKFCAGAVGVACPTSATTAFFKVGADVSATGDNLIAAIISNSVTGAVITGTNTVGTIDLVSKFADGVAYTLTTSGAKMTVSGNMGDGVAATVFTTDKITIPATSLSSGLKVALTGSNLPTGLTATDYWVIKIDANTIKLASSLTNAIAGTAVDITAVSVGASSNTFTLTPASITGTPSFKWQVSNDGSNWADLSVSSVTMSAYTLGGATSIWDFSWFDYNWLRLNVVGPTTGGIQIKAILSPKN